MPFGFRSTGTFNGGPNVGALREFAVANSYGTALFKGDPVTVSAGYIVKAANGDKVMGIFQGAKFIDPINKQYTVTQYLPASTSSAGRVEGQTTPVALVDVDPETTYVIECKAGLALAQTDIGKTFTVSLAGAGNTATGLSSAVLDTAVTTLADAMVQVVDLYRIPGNEFGVSANQALVKIVNQAGNK
jgi:hypothetical protein